MAGLYIHIPFCARRCIYCGFFSTTFLSRRQDYVEALCQEMRLRGGSPIETIYLGGGTPSQLSPSQLHQLFDAIAIHYPCDYSHAEITMECNPDDVTATFVQALRKLPVNRVSMGIQSFSDERLRFLHRRHDARQSREAVSLLRSAGIENISIDLMFGFPHQTPEQWEADIDAALRLNIEHLSAYSLMYEEGTPLYEMLERNEVEEIDDETYIIMYNTLVRKLREAGYEHYEISNFARPGKRSRHNSNYWDWQKPYIGIGAGAHSYDLTGRQYNVEDIDQYIVAIGNGQVPAVREELSATDHYNDIITTALRTSSGISLPAIEQQFGIETLEYLLDCSVPHLNRHWLVKEDNHLRLTLEGIAMSDTVMSDLTKI